MGQRKCKMEWKHKCWFNKEENAYVGILVYFRDWTAGDCNLCIKNNLRNLMDGEQRDRVH